ncbi:hypothetical protein X975_20247, partial [Stegodyphus mimosarum]
MKITGSVLKRNQYLLKHQIEELELMVIFVFPNHSCVLYPHKQVPLYHPGIAVDTNINIIIIGMLQVLLAFCIHLAAHHTLKIHQ